MSKNKAFTLVELLVVIAIIAILMAILIPALTRVKDQAMNIVCANNLKSYATVANMYPDDNDGAFPLSFLGVYNKQYWSWCIWHDEQYDLQKHPELAGAFWPYLVNKKIMLCSRFATLARAIGSSHPGDDAAIAMNPIFSYTQNAFLGVSQELGVSFNFNVNQLAASSVKTGEVRFPAQTAFYSEENFWYGTPPRCADPINDTNMKVGDNIAGYVAIDMFGSFHNTPTSNLDKGGANVVFVDGHTEFVKLTIDQILKGEAWRLVNTKSKALP